MSPKAAVFSIAWSNRGCPSNSDDVAEAYWMGLLPGGEMQALEAHCASCPDCGRTFAKARDFVAAFHECQAVVGHEVMKRVKTSTAQAATGRKYTNRTGTSGSRGRLNLRAAWQQMRAAAASAGSSGTETDSPVTFPKATSRKTRKGSGPAQLAAAAAGYTGDSRGRVLVMPFRLATD